MSSQIISDRPSVIWFSLWRTLHCRYMAGRACCWGTTLATRGRKGVVTRRLGDSSTFSDSFERRLGVTYTPPLLHVIAVRLKRHLLRRRSRSALETVKLTLQIIMGTEGSCKKVMIKLSPSTATKRENIIELLNQRIPYCSLTPPALTCPFGNITVFFITTFSSTRQRLIHIFIVHFKCDHLRQSGFGHQRLY